MSQHLEQLNQAFALDQHLQFTASPGDYRVAEVNNRFARASIALQGAHVLRFQPHGQQPVLWLSELAKFAAGKSVRGGAPVCWPWFGAHPDDAAKPGHGYARTVPWQVISSGILDNGATRLVLQLQDSDATRAQWPHPACLQLHVTVAESLRLDLCTRNLGDDDMVIGEALHTYFQVSDIGQIKILGLDGCTYADKTIDMQRKVQDGAITLNGEMDRVYVDTAATCFIEDPGYQRRVCIAKQSSLSTIVWTPWQDKADKMGDFGEQGQGWRRMVCVESGNALEHTVSIPAGAEHCMQVEYSVETL